MAQVTFTPEEIAEFPPGPAGPQGEQGVPGEDAVLVSGPQGFYLRSDTQQTEGIGWGRPLDAIDVVKEGGLKDDVGQAGTPTNNSPKLQALYNQVLTTGNGRYSWFVFPKTVTGRYGFGDLGGGKGPNCAGKSIRHVGTGAAMYQDGTQLTALVPLVANMKTILVDGGGTLHHAGPSFERLTFGRNGLSGITGLYIRNNNRVHLSHITFGGLINVGVETDEGGGDCAYHNWHSVDFSGCVTGWLGTSANSMRLFGVNCCDCTVGLDLIAVNQLSVHGIKINLPPSGQTTGIRTRGYASSFFGVSGEGYANGTGTLIRVWGDGSDTKGNGNTFLISSMHGHGAAGNKGLQFDVGANNNKYLIGWASAFSAGSDIVDNGMNNRGL